MRLHRITPCLWFDDNAEAAVNHYVSIFPNSKINKIARYGEAGPGKPGSVMMMTFELDGHGFQALNGGPMFKFTEAISLSVACADQAEVDHYWSRLLEGGTPSRCGWLKDRFGLSWQINPIVLGQMLGDEDRERAGRVMQAMLKMGKIEIAELQRAYDGE